MFLAFFILMSLSAIIPPRRKGLNVFSIEVFFRRRRVSSLAAFAHLLSPAVAFGITAFLKCVGCLWAVPVPSLILGTCRSLAVERFQTAVRL